MSGNLSRAGKSNKYWWLCLLKPAPGRNPATAKLKTKAGYKLGDGNYVGSTGLIEQRTGVSRDQ